VATRSCVVLVVSVELLGSMLLLEVVVVADDVDAVVLGAERLVEVSVVVDDIDAVVLDAELVVGVSVVADDVDVDVVVGENDVVSELGDVADSDEIRVVGVVESVDENVVSD